MQCQAKLINEPKSLAVWARHLSSPFFWRYSFTRRASPKRLPAVAALRREQVRPEIGFGADVPFLAFLDSCKVRSIVAARATGCE